MIHSFHCIIGEHYLADDNLFDFLEHISKKILQKVSESISLAEPLSGVAMSVFDCSDSALSCPCIGSNVLNQIKVKQEQIRESIQIHIHSLIWFCRIGLNWTMKKKERRN